MRAPASASMVEFVSANPTGPLHVGHGRQAALGDAIASAARVAGLRRSRASSTTTTPARRSRTSPCRCARARTRSSASRATFPEDGYHGEYIREIAQRYLDEVGPRPVRPRGDPPLRRRLAAQRAGSRPAGVRREVRPLLPRKLALHRRPGRRTVEQLVGAGKTYEKTARCGCARPTTATTRTA